MALDRDMEQNLLQIQRDIDAKQDERTRLAQEQERLKKLIDDAKSAEGALRKITAERIKLVQEEQRLKKLIDDAKSAERPLDKTVQKLRELDRDLDNFKKALKDLNQQIDVARRKAA